MLGLLIGALAAAGLAPAAVQAALRQEAADARHLREWQREYRIREVEMVSAGEQPI